ncbi:MAG: class II aldolase/adducin family protein [Planctomycetota bacterium]
MDTLQKKYEAEINELVKACRSCAEKRYVSSHGGNLSHRVAEDIVLITPTKLPKELVAFDDVVIVDMKGDILLASDGRKPTGETPMHINMFEKRPDLNAIIHSHPPVLTGFAIAHSELLAKAILPEVVIEVGPVLSVDYAEPLTDELAASFDKVLDYSNAFLMKNHGVMVCAREGSARALEFTDMLEALAQSIATAQSLGEVNLLTDTDISNLENVMKTRNMLLPGNPEKVESLISLFKNGL